MKKPPENSRFQPSVWSERLVPALLILLTLTLILTLGIVALSILGLLEAP